ncbi:unnamed protein product [Sphenostylis stenocarpa]|uniref:Uncharacterized protein n=1 Tax=Sphenostylis stenocarpa TaxID=92480 RepID=A0AA86RLJ6_9FABA|nr:unnamed protein product [Sphenostylis stenocarpa]
MNPTTTQPPPPSLPPPSLPPPPQLQPHRHSTSCDRHPQEIFTGFCPSCLCERLVGLDPNSSSSSAATRKPPSSSTAAAALKAIFRPSAAARRPPPSSLSELRRTKSFSASKNEALSGFFEPQRRSCDVRARSTLFSLFNQEAEVETRHVPSSSVVQKPVLESEEEEDEDDEEDNIVVQDANDIIVPESPQPQPTNIENRVSEIVEEESETVPEPEVADVADEDALKAMKDHMDLDSQTKKTSGRDLKGSFWSAASVFSKKLQKWRQKQKMKKRERNGVVVGSGTLLPVEKPIARQFRETQSEIADYGFGRRSCDTDPRFSLDAARMSFDFEEPRASWDGYLMARTAPTFAVPPRMPTMIEDAPAPVQVLRTDSLIPVEEPEYEETLTLNLNHNPNLNANHNVNVNPNLPGGSTQTREYYSDSSSRRRKSLDRSSSIRRTAAAVVAEMDELKSVSIASATTNARVTPAASADYVHNPLRDSNSNSNSLRDDGCEKGASKKSSSRWSKAWSIWGLIHRRGSKEEDGAGNGNGNGVERSYSESWQEYRGGERNGDVRGGAFNPKMMRSNSSVSWRNAQGIGGVGGGGGFGSVSMRKSDVQGNGLGLGLGLGGGGRKGRDEFVGLERNRSARYSPNNIDNNGLLRLYLGGRRNGSGKGRSNQAHSIARSVLRLY